MFDVDVVACEAAGVLLACVAEEDGVLFVCAVEAAGVVVVGVLVVALAGAGVEVDVAAAFVDTVGVAWLLFFGVGAGLL